jgi:dihydrodipicolinate synthase/N-acetylneuraminate lyase
MNTDVRRKLYPAMLTPLTDGGERPDESAFAPMIEFLLERGADGLFVLGTTGEGINLSLDERRQVARLAHAALAGRGDLVVHCGAQTTRDTAMLAADAAELGASGVAVIPPPYFPLDDASLEEHLVAAARACAPTPFFIYAFAARSGYPVSVEVVRRVRERASNLAGVKVSESPFQKVAPYMELGLPIYIGNEPMIAPAAAAGEIAGSVSALASVFPEATRALLDEPTAQRGAAAEELRGAISQQPLIPTAKAVLGARGVPIRPAVRRPLMEVTAEQTAEAVRRADALLGAAR